MAPDSEPAPSEERGSRTHPVTGVIQGLIWSGAILVALLGQQVFGGDGIDLPGWYWIVLGLLGAVAVGQAAGFASWWFLRYVIDHEELRVTSGVLTKTSRRVSFERIQSVDLAEPLLARLAGLAEVRVETAGGKDSRTALRFLTRPQAIAVRRLLLERAHGRSGEEPEDDVDRAILALVTPDRIVIGTLLSLDFALAAVGSVVVLSSLLWTTQLLLFAGGLFALGSFLVRIVSDRVITQWGFRLSRGGRGLRIERGLLSRTSQTIPFDRVQGIRVTEPVVWRRFGWRRLEVDVAGYSGGSDGESGGLTNNTLLPIADADLANTVIDELVPGIAVEPAGRVGASSRSWPFAPIGWRYRWVAADDSGFVARTGWIARHTDLVPHARTQSVEVRQGPLQRRLGVATLEVHTPDGPVNADGRHLPQSDALRVALEQLDRARAAR
ncbi:hypothetical protein HMPREF0063_12339 [Aeromicrobium marinum DSM 15272]|uniref:YdbS-like PH domain-containing protein n=1 Tax=Aeromicrobium marinum DSM 15272 TaxID=585531 RepID=E2SD27_9ACTN|nr:PH domain-containing protein [Aeromicrobium marinum]EFQ83130.1 hypothetical protein HMPREF0063_12339 [Aeromicrobium marinum DSM 15272]